MRTLSRAGIALGAALLATTAVPAASAQAEDRGTCVSRQGWGELCLKFTNNGYSISYYKAWNPGNQVDTLDFNLDCANGRWFGDEGAFTQASWTWKSYTFSVGNQGRCWGVLIDVDNGQRMEGAAVNG